MCVCVCFGGGGAAAARRAHADRGAAQIEEIRKKEEKRLNKMRRREIMRKMGCLKYYCCLFDRLKYERQYGATGAMPAMEAKKSEAQLKKDADVRPRAYARAVRAPTPSRACVRRRLKRCAGTRSCCSGRRRSTRRTMSQSGAPGWRWGWGGVGCVAGSWRTLIVLGNSRRRASAEIGIASGEKSAGRQRRRRRLCTCLLTTARWVVVWPPPPLACSLHALGDAARLTAAASCNRSARRPDRRQ